MTTITRPDRPAFLLRAVPAPALPVQSIQSVRGTPTTARATRQHEEVVPPGYLVSLRSVPKLFVFGWLIAFILLASMPLQAHADPRAPKTSDAYSVLGSPSVSAAFINRVLRTYHSPTAGKGSALYKDGVAYGIDPVFALAFFMHESTFGTAGVARVTRSLGNIRCTPGYPSCYKGYRAYDTWQEGFIDWYRLIRNLYVAQWDLTTVDQIIPVYAPASENNVHAYIVAVKHAVDTWRNGQVIVPPLDSLQESSAMSKSK
jgi:Mannosyl-glycoprotein endo-beta-N-acetylglucosaminidase